MSEKTGLQQHEVMSGRTSGHKAAGMKYVSDLMAELDPQQKEAVTHTGIPSLVLAGAGSGKTRVITYRIAYLVGALNIKPDRILAVTFTNKAANEMKERLDKMGPTGGEGFRGLWVHTFHRACSRILRKDGREAGLAPGFTVADYQDQVGMVRRIIRDQKSQPGTVGPEGWLARIGKLKDNLVRPEDMVPSDEEESYLARLYAEYQEKLRHDNLLDFDDLLMETERLFREHPSVLEKYRERFPHVLVDEFQDTNSVQYILMKMLAGDGAGLFVVGDEDQSIYRWRGAAPGNFRRIREEFPAIKSFFLENNYRSTHVILKAAARLIEKSLDRTPKKLRASRRGGDRVAYIECRDEREEATYVTGRIKRLLISRYKPEQIAVLYRVNAQSPPFERALSAAGIQYRLLGGTRFFTRQEVKDVLAYIRLAINPDDDASFRRVINTPPRRIGASTMEQLERKAADIGGSLYGAGALMSGEASPAGRRVASFIEIVDGLHSLGGSMSPVELFRVALGAGGYEDWLRSGALGDPGGRLENIAQLGRFFADLPPAAEEEGGVAEFLDEVALLSDADEEDAPGVSLMTLHSAKGLEFPVVFLVGMEEGLLPHSRALTDVDELEEERRLCYVGMTRARNMLFLTGAVSRIMHGRVMWNNPSRFLEDIAPDTPSPEEEVGRRVSTGRVPVCEDYALGRRVSHPVFGVGTILKREGSGEDLKLLVGFPGYGNRKLLARLANLK